MSISSVLSGWFTHNFGGAGTASNHESYDLIEKGDFCLNLNTRRVSVREKRLELTSEEFDLLYFLLSHPQKLVTPRTVLVSSRTMRRIPLMQTLLSLRRKLDAVAEGRQYLRTDLWVVYRFNGYVEGPL